MVNADGLRKRSGERQRSGLCGHKGLGLLEKEKLDGGLGAVEMLDDACSGCNQIVS